MMRRRAAAQPGPSAGTRPGPLPLREHKEAFVTELFARIAPRYDGMNRLMTFGLDRRWRRLAVREALGWKEGRVDRGRGPARVLDVATGTGDLAVELLRQDPALHVVGLDLVPEMLAIARRKADALLGPSPGAPGDGAGGRLDLVLGDALHLPFGDGEFDAVVTGFALRYVLDIPAAFAEMARVTRRGGRLACLELSRPRLPVLRQLHSVYSFRIVPLLGRLVAREAAAYTYLPHSVSAFLSPDEVAEVMRSSGWREVRHRRMGLGAVALHVGTRG